MDDLWVLTFILVVMDIALILMGLAISFLVVRVKRLEKNQVICLYDHEE